MEENNTKAEVEYIIPLEQGLFHGKEQLFQVVYRQRKTDTFLSFPKNLESAMKHKGKKCIAYGCDGNVLLQWKNR